MYETPQGLYGTVWSPLGHRDLYDFILTEAGQPILVDGVLLPGNVVDDRTVLIVEQSDPNLWTII